MVALDADHPYIVARLQSTRVEPGLLDRRGTNAYRVIRDNRVIVQRMQLLDLALDLQRAGERDGDVAHRNRHRIPVDEYIATFLVDDHARPVIVTLANARQRVWQIECDDDQ